MSHGNNVELMEASAQQFFNLSSNHVKIPMKKEEKKSHFY